MRQLLFPSFVLILVGTIFGVDGKLVKVSSGGELQSALDSARPGDTIQLNSGVYEGDYVASGDGPITVTGITLIIYSRYAFILHLYSTR